MNRIYEARQFAHAAHDSIGQKRKYRGLPYWTHTDEVAEIVFNEIYPLDYIGLNDSQEIIKIRQDADDVVIATHCHDIIEDVFPINPYYDLYLIAKKFGGNVAKIVTELTDVYTPESWPDLNREKRKKLEAERLGKISKPAKIIKLADLISNTSTIVEHDPEFAKIYLKEKERVLEYIKDGNEELYKRNLEIIKNAKLILDKLPE